MSNPSNNKFARRLEELHESHRKIRHEIAKVIIGQNEVIDQILVALFCKSHCLLVGVPGLAKTAMVSALSECLSLSFKRIQFTPDLMPSDITGTNVLEEDENGRRSMSFLPGPIFAHIVLADEINRTPPKTQAALLESMQEFQVSVGKETYELPSPFCVIATQNPIEQEGTYPLPEAQLDRFMFNILVDYPDEKEEIAIYKATTGKNTATIDAVLNAKEILRMQKVVSEILVADYVVEYASRLVRATRPTAAGTPDFIKEFVEWGAGPRAGQSLIKGAKAFAALDGRPNASCDDIRKVCIPVLRHRIGLSFAAETEGMDTVALVNRLVKEIDEPER